MARTLPYPEPRVSEFLFASKAMAPVWAIIRIYLGWMWLTAGWGKVTSPAWTGENAGAAVTGYLRGALGRAEGESPSVTGWYAWMIENLFLPNATLMSWMVAWGEVLVGIALIVGALTGVAALFGAVMNFNFMLAGTASTNPVLFLFAVLLLLAWKVSGYIGIDRWLLPALGTPWSPGAVIRRRRAKDQEAEAVE